MSAESSPKPSGIRGSMLVIWLLTFIGSFLLGEWVMDKYYMYTPLMHPIRCCIDRCFLGTPGTTTREPSPTEIHQSGIEKFARINEKLRQLVTAEKLPKSAHPPTIIVVPASSGYNIYKDSGDPRVPLPDRLPEKADQLIRDADL